VTFGIDISAYGSQAQPLTLEMIVEDVSRVLRTEGFEVMMEHPNHIANGKEDEAAKMSEGWLHLFDVSSRIKAEKSRRLARVRRKKHLERCESCRSGLEHSEAMVGQAVSSHNNQLGDVLLRTNLSISGMTCASCTTSIHSALSAHPDILDVSVNLLASSAVVQHKSTLSPAKIADMVEDIGFEAQVSSSSPEGGPEQLRSAFSIHGMTCASCSSSIERTLRPVAGINQVSIDVLGNRGVVLHTSDLSAAAIQQAIEDTGFDAELIETKLADSPASTMAQASTQLRKVTIRVEGIFCGDCVNSLNDYLASIPVESFTKLDRNIHSTTITYKPHDPLDIRSILTGISNIATEFSAEITKPLTSSDRGRAIQQREFRILAVHLAVAVLFAIPTFVM
jgi:copper ion binding protein